MAAPQLVSELHGLCLSLEHAHCQPATPRTAIRDTGAAARGAGTAISGAAAPVSGAATASLAALPVPNAPPHALLRLPRLGASPTSPAYPHTVRLIAA